MNSPTWMLSSTIFISIFRIQKARNVLMLRKISHLWVICVWGSKIYNPRVKNKPQTSHKPLHKKLCLPDKVFFCFSSLQHFAKRRENRPPLTSCWISFNSKESCGTGIIIVKVKHKNLRIKFMCGNLRKNLSTETGKFFIQQPSTTICFPPQNFLWFYGFLACFAS